MKYLIILIIPIFLFTCTNGTNQEALRKENEALKNENKLLKNNQRKQEASISGYRRTLEEIDFNLKKIELNWSLIYELEPEAENTKGVEDRIKERIIFIDNIIRNTNLKIQLLDKNLNNLRKDANKQSDEILNLDRSLKNSARTLIEKEQEHNIKREALELEIEDLEKVYQEQKAYTEELRQILNRAYYYFGTSKELQNHKIIDKTGGFIGIGRVKILNAQDAGINFNQIEKDKTNHFNIPGRGIKLISNHPKSSFNIQYRNNINTLNILDKKEFWKTGNYLIIQIN